MVCCCELRLRLVATLIHSRMSSILHAGGGMMLMDFNSDVWSVDDERCRAMSHIITDV